MGDVPENETPFGVAVLRFAKLADARERGLVLAAIGLTYAIARDGEGWTLSVSPEDVSRALMEIEAYDAELRGVAIHSAVEVPAKVGYWTVPLVALVLVGFAILQAERGDRWTEAGILSSEWVMGRGEWWRTVTALTLHGDVPHVLANLGAGLIFGALLFPAFGQGLAWLMVLLSGALGNALSVWVCYPQPYRSLGASTAVFGALGLLVGDALWRLLRFKAGRLWWAWVLPLGAGVALLAFLGAGEGKKNVDVLAHLWGFALGLPLGMGVSIFSPAQNSRALQLGCGVGVFVVLALAWGLACRYGLC